MLQSELSYVREKLKSATPDVWKEVKSHTGVSMKTLRRMAFDESRFARSDNTGKVALFFRTREKRGKQREAA